MFSLNINVEQFVQYCYSCVDGGILYACEECGHFICNKCVQLPLHLANMASLFFWCPTCHNSFFRKEKLGPNPYFVSNYQLMEMMVLILFIHMIGLIQKAF